MALALSQVIAEREAPESITVDNGTEFASKAMDAWAYQYRVQLDFIRPGRPVENGYIESFTGRLRDECLNVHVFFTLADVREKLELWRDDYNQVRPHSALDDYAPRQFVQHWRSSALACTAGPPNQAAAGAAQCAPASHPEPKQLSGPPSSDVKSGPEKLVIDHAPTDGSSVLLEVLS